MNVYHGSYTEARKIDLFAAKPKRDFGKGFYVTTNRKQAEVWAEIQGRRNNCSGVVSLFEFSENAFSDNYYKTIKFSGYTDNWFEFVVKNRSNNLESNAHDYDIVEEPVADDDIYENVEKYIAGKILKEEFFESLKI